MLPTLCQYHMQQRFMRQRIIILFSITKGSFGVRVALPPTSCVNISVPQFSLMQNGDYIADLLVLTERLY